MDFSNPCEFEQSWERTFLQQFSIVNTKWVLIFDRESIAAVLQPTKLDFGFFFFLMLLLLWTHFKNFIKHGEIQDKFESMMKFMLNLKSW